jgi:hypothetical protein
MVSKEEIEKLINIRLNFVLLVAQSSLPENQFKAFRKLTLDSFGNSGLGKDLDRILKEKNSV